jgi:hypothetical protein
MANQAGGEDNITTVVSFPKPSLRFDSRFAEEASSTVAEYVTIEESEIESMLDDTMLE